MVIDLYPIILTLKVALITSIILLFIGIFLAWWLATKPSVLKTVVEIICLLPLLLPPTVLGFYFLIVFNNNSIIGNLFFKTFGYTLNFTQTAIIIASVIYSLPFMIQPLKASFKQIPEVLIAQASMLGKNNLYILLNVILPNSISGVLSGFILSFMHTMGEFGVVLMIGGNIPNKTQMVSIKLYEEVESLNYYNAHMYALILVVFATIALIVIDILSRKNIQHRR